MFALSSKLLLAQDRFVEIEEKLKALTETIPALDQKVDVSVNGVTIQEFIRGIASSTNLNLSVDPVLSIKVTNSFNQIPVKDILIFVCRVYKLDISVIGSIINIVGYKEPIPVKIAPPEKKLNISYDSQNDLLSFDFEKDTLSKVSKEITNITSKNIALSPGINNITVSGYVKQMPFDAAIEKFCFSNNLNVSKSDDQFYLIEKNEDATNKETSGKQKRKNILGGNRSKKDILKVSSVDSISIDVTEQPLADVISSVSNKVAMPFTFLSEIKGNTTVNIKNSEYEEFLLQVLKGTPYSYKFENGIYFIGDKKLEELKESRVISLQYRTVDKLKELLPQSLTKDLELMEFVEQNSLVVTGNVISIKALENLILEIDKVVPVILIEVIIVDVNKNNSVSTGITAGIGTAPVSKQTVLPNTEWTFGSQSINSLINSFNGFGWIKLGKVAPNFYLKIKALEDNGLLKIRSTPKLSTLNGHEALLTSGETKYYKEEQSNYIGSQNPSLSNSYTWKSTKADLNVTIKPIVSSDDQITLDIKVEQSEFTPREFENAPPGQVSRTFQSLIRVKNEEMVLLGGLEKTTSNASSSGLPLLSRIPIIRWFFGNRTKSKTETKLSIFIKPTVIY